MDKETPLSRVSDDGTRASLTSEKQADTLLADMVDSVLDHLKAADWVGIGGLGLIEVKDCESALGPEVRR